MDDPRVPRTARALLLTLVASALCLAGPLPSPAYAAVPPGPQARTTTVTPPRPETPAATRTEALALLHRAQAALDPAPDARPAGRLAGRGPRTELTTTLTSLFRARAALTGADRRAADRVLARPTDDSRSDPVSYAGLTDHLWCRPGSHFCVHWVTSGANRVPARDADHDRVPDQVETTGATLDRVWTAEVGRLGYRPPLSDAATVGVEPGNPDGRVDVYLAQLGPKGLYGYCAPEGTGDERQTPGYCVLDNDYSTREYATSSPLLPLRVTAAHEFFHDVQFGYDVDEDTWFMEGTATWVEDEVFDAVDDNYQYLWSSPLRSPSRALDYSVDLHPYGAWLFFRYASESLGGPDVVRSSWEAADAGRSAYSLPAIVPTVAALTPWSDFFVRFAVWNLLPPGSYRERAHYPAPVYRATRTLTPRAPSTGTVRSNLVHLSSAAVRVVPGPTLGVDRRLRVTVDAPDLVRGPAAALLVRGTDGSATTVSLPLDAQGRGTTVVGFDRRRVRSVSVVVANTSTAMRSCGTVRATGGGPLYSCDGRGTFDPTRAAPGTYAISARAF